MIIVIAAGVFIGLLLFKARGVIGVIFLIIIVMIMNHMPDTAAPPDQHTEQRAQD